MKNPLHPQLASDCYTLGQLGSSTLLLHKNAHVPWFILVPDTNATEIFHMDEPQQAEILSAINQLTRFIEAQFTPDKINFATIGNLVPQLHIHIIGRYKTDPWWPAPVWGQSGFQDYTDSNLEDIKQALARAQIPSLSVS